MAIKLTLPFYTEQRKNGYEQRYLCELSRETALEGIWIGVCKRQKKF